MEYQHTQTGVLQLCGVGLGLVITIIVAIFWTPTWVLTFPAGLLVAAAVIYSGLTVEIRDGRLKCWFGPGVVFKDVSLADVADAQIARHHWYYGWGIRWTPYGWTYNVSGLDVVEITMTSGKRFRVGTDEPRALAEAIRGAKDGDIAIT